MLLIDYIYSPPSSLTNGICAEFSQRALRPEQEMPEIIPMRRNV